LQSFLEWSAVGCGGRTKFRYNAPTFEPRVDYSKLLTENLGLLKSVVQSVARRHHLAIEEAEEAFGDLQLKLVENDYQILRQFQQRASLRTYLTVVATRHVLDRRNAIWGRWRPSIHAKRMGRVAILLERMLMRDRLTFEEAVQSLRYNHNIVATDDELHRISAGFPQRSTRQFVDAAVLDDVPAPEMPGVDLDASRTSTLAGKIAAAMRSALAELDSIDRLILKMHFQESIRISSIAKVLKIEQKLLYRRRDRVLAGLAHQLAREGIARDEVRAIIGDDLQFGLAEETPSGIDNPRPTI
jgi:RNA polymerase sigma factor for flagellar operon FliA